jgi:NAD(P)-dependent dehydrogenase (short-subunit alcohol dehydrogenase family)
MARRLAAEGARVIITGRSLPRLEKVVRDLASSGANPAAFSAIDADLTEPEGRHKLVHAIDRRFGALDLVIHAAQAGVNECLDLSVERLRELFEINLFAMLDLTRSLEPLLEAGTNPAIVSLGIVGRNPAAPRSPGYAATLAAIEACGTSLRPDSVIERLTVTPEPDHPDRLATRVLSDLGQSKFVLLKHQMWMRMSYFGVAKLLRSRPASGRTFPKPDTRLPRPHFVLRMNRFAKKGD